MTFEVSPMSLSISKDQKQLSAPWWHLKCHQWAYWFRRTRNNYLYHDDIWSVTNELIDFEGPETIICTMMTLKCHQWAYWFRRTRHSYLHYDDIWSVINELIDFKGPETIICTLMTFKVSSMSLSISRDQKQLSSLWWHLKCHQWAYWFRRTRNNYLHYDDIWSVINELIDFEGPEKIICTMMTFEV